MFPQMFLFLFLAEYNELHIFVTEVGTLFQSLITSFAWSVIQFLPRITESVNTIGLGYRLNTANNKVCSGEWYPNVACNTIL